LIENRIREALRRAVESLGIPVEGDILLERPHDEIHGDLASPVAMVLSSRAKRSPRAIARDILERMGHVGADIKEVRIEGPGFINFEISDSYYRRTLRAIVEEADKFGRDIIGGGDKRRIIIEFVSSNPTGPLTVGHGRQAVLGDVIANLLEWTGHEVIREYYFNDAGRQMDLLGRSVFARYAQLFDPDYPFPEDGYRGEYIMKIAGAIRDDKGDSLRPTDGSPDENALEFMKREAAERMVGVIKEDLRDFRIHFDNWYNESSLLGDGKTAEVLRRLDAVGAVYEKDGAVWFRASRYGDEEDRVLVKGSGDHTYFLTDIAYHMVKHERGFDQAINLHGADHYGYVPRMKAAMKALGYPDTFLRYLIHQMVTFVEGGEQLRMSTRAGTFITLRELMDKVGVDVARYFFIMIKPDSHLVFDLDLAQSRSINNPVYYLQYANARISSIFKFAEKEGVLTEGQDLEEEVDLSLLGSEEMAVMKRLSFFPAVVHAASEDLEPHRLTSYLEDLTSSFHHWYERQRVVVEDHRLTRARLYLCQGVRQILRSALMILGMSIPDHM
jgi:arginyl-tRNA synthetase